MVLFLLPLVPLVPLVLFELSKYNNTTIRGFSAHSFTTEGAGVGMVDTVWLTTNNFCITDKNKFEVHEVIRRSGEVTAPKQVCNAGDRDMAEQLKAAGLPVQGNMAAHSWYGGKPLLQFNVALPKLLHGHSMTEVGAGDLDRCAEAIYKQLTFAGVGMDRRDIVNMNVARIDYCHNVTIDGNMAEYLYLLNNSTLPHAEHKPQPHGTALFLNKSWQYTAYDKVNEVYADTKQRIAAGILKDTPHNVLRFEYRITGGNGNVRRILDNRRTFAQCYDYGLARQAVLNKFDKLRLDSTTKARINTSPLHALFATCSHGTVKDSIAMPVILAAVNNDLDLLQAYLQQRYSYRQALTIRHEYEVYLNKVNVPAHRDLWQELRTKLAA